MARHTGAVCRLCRREGTKLFLKGERCYTGKCAVDRRGYPPGQHGQGRKRVSEYALHLREKQKARRTYGVLERQFRRYYDLAARRRGITGENLLQLLETRLDNVVYRLGFASSRPEARQLVLHGHFSVNGRKVTVPSYQVRPGDVVAIREGSRNLDKFKANLEVGRMTPPWMTLDVEKMEGEILSLPTRDQIDVPVQEHLIVEYYSR